MSLFATEHDFIPLLKVIELLIVDVQNVARLTQQAALLVIEIG
jgi:hypothetical protein